MEGDRVERITQLRDLSEEEIIKATEAAGEHAEDVYAILLKDGTFTFREGSWDLQTSSVTEDMVAYGHLGRKE
jgi:hypothetical protein